MNTVLREIPACKTDIMLWFGLVARLAAESPSVTQLAQIEKNCPLLARYGNNGDPQAFFETASEFHWILLRGAHIMRRHIRAMRGALAGVLR